MSTLRRSLPMSHPTFGRGGQTTMVREWKRAALSLTAVLVGSTALAAGAARAARDVEPLWLGAWSVKLKPGESEWIEYPGDPSDREPGVVWTAGARDDVDLYIIDLPPGEDAKAKNLVWDNSPDNMPAVSWRVRSGHTYWIRVRNASEIPLTFEVRSALAIPPRVGEGRPGEVREAAPPGGRQ